MEFIQFFLHIDKHLVDVITHYGFWTYLILFLIIFCETGLVVTPFLPGDSLLFATGALAAKYPGEPLNVGLVFAILTIAAILGDSLNYTIGSFLGKKMIEKKIPFVKKEYIEKTHQFYEKYGPKAIVLARFVPIVRTFAPFVAGIGKMSYRTFFIYNVVGGIAWVSIFIFGGYWVGNIPIIQKNFSIVTILIILISIMPIFIEWVKHKKKQNEKKG